MIETDALMLSEEEKNEIIRYGIKQGKIMIGSAVITLVIGYIFQVFVQSIIFLMTFCAIRRYAGGYHSDSQRRCYVISLLLVILSLWSIRTIKWDLWTCMMLQTVSFVTILVLAPVESNNRKLDEHEKQEYGRKTRIISSVIYMVSLVMYYKSKIYIIIPVCVAYFLVFLSLTAGYFKLFWKRSLQVI